MNDKKRVNKRLLILVLLLLITMVSGTFAWFTYRSKESALVLTIGDINNSKVIIKPYQIRETLTPVNTYTSGVYSQVQVNNNGNSELNAVLYYKLNQLDDTLKNNGLKYTIVSSATIDGIYTEVKTGDFTDFKGRGNYPIYSIKVNSGTNLYYRVYLWLDSSVGNQNDIQNTSLDVELNASINQIPIAPVLDSGMIPVVISDNGSVTTVLSTDEDWYDYNNQKWANVVLVSNESRNTYLNTENVPVNSNDILGYYVWIPRYRYKIWTNDLSSMGNEQSIDIVFETENNTTMSLGTAVYEYRTHPAFWWDADSDSTFDDGELLPGIWVGKFETTGTVEEPTVLNGKTPLSNIAIKDHFVTSLKFAGGNMNTTNGAVSFFGNNTYGLTVKTDSHMMKNSEWGAVAYLSHSYYGINDEIRLNNHSDLLTGCGASSNNAAEIADCEISYGGASEYPQSTTGNISGIFDMSGGVNEYLMGNYKGFNGVGLFSTFPSNKYYDIYTSDNLLTSCSGGVCYGHALSETYNWYSDSVDFTTELLPWIIRGGADVDEEDAGIFHFSIHNGEAHRWIGARSVLIPSPDTSYIVTLNHQNATTAGTASVTATYGNPISNIDVPTKTGNIFKGYYSTTNALDMVYVLSNPVETIKRISFLDKKNSWLLTSSDAGTHIQLKLTVQDSNLTSAPTLDFNDITLVNGVHYNSFGGNGTWTYNIDFDITDEMVSSRNYNFDTSHRFIDLNGVTSSSVVTVDLAVKNGKKYYDNLGNNVWNYDVFGNTTLYAIWQSYNVYIQYNVNGGTVTSQTTYTDGTVNNWKTIDDIVYKNDNENFSKISYGGTGNLVNYNYSSYLNITKTGYKAVSGSEWKCMSNNCAKQTYNHLTDYNASDFCDALNGDCTVILGVNWTPSTYTVVAHPYEGTIPSTSGWAAVGGLGTYKKTVTYSSTYGTLPTPTRTGYIFAGWYNVSQATNINLTATTGNWNFSNVLFKIYPGITYTVTMDSAVLNSGTATQFSTLIYDFTDSKTLVTINNSFSNSSISYNITAPDFDSSHDVRIIVYAGVAGSTSGVAASYTNVRAGTMGATTATKYQSANSVSYAGNHMLFAHWTPNTYTISYNACSGTGVPANQTKTHGVTLTLSSTKPTKTGYTFGGWSTSGCEATSATYSAGGSYTENASATLYAVWQSAWVAGKNGSFEITPTAYKSWSSGKLRITWEEKYNLSENKSIVYITNFELWSDVEVASMWVGGGNDENKGLFINDTLVQRMTYSSGATGFPWFSGNKWVELDNIPEPFPWASGELTHNADGTLTVPIKFDGMVTPSNWNYYASFSNVVTNITLTDTIP